MKLLFSDYLEPKKLVAFVGINPPVRQSGGFISTQNKMSKRGLPHLCRAIWLAAIGVDIYRLSTMHYVGDALPDEIRNRFKPSDKARAKYPEDQWMIEAWVPAVKPWYTIQDKAYFKGFIIDACIGNAKCMFFKVRPVIELYRQALLERFLGLYGLC